MNASSARAHWHVAFSGGADSLALLLLLWAHWPERRRRLGVLHFDHRLRGPASRADALFCRQVCATLKVTLRSAAWTDRPTKPSEAQAREARMAFFQKHARGLFLGHQQDDIAETMLMRLARGSGAGGLAAPRPVQTMPGAGVRLRPLLSLKKAEIVAALRAQKIPWREDATNAGPIFFRNRVRRDVVPAWGRAAERDALAGAARARELLEEDDVALESWLDSLHPLGARGTLSLAKLAGKPRALLRRALHRWLGGQPHAGDVSRQAFDALLGALERGRPTRHSLGREGFAVITQRELRFERSRNFRRKFRRRAN
ncbi:MAG TPA: tRNA lysidine(34) synthetase TilS [Opitutaceae bacterium]|nr:tRNA lysidine(34) synthetase TilS [Opitutaceae bacterium]